ncbi:MAG: hypothetical protein LBB56_08035 [Chitinispirillales bacterium]|jgi:hypothetical protein|nr:hypothetical protein [Chitinispirillales bacterium]
MSELIPREKAARIKDLVYSKADTHGYIARGRNENGQFMTALVEDFEVGGVLSEYMEKGKIRTYIKDSILNGYTKCRKKEILESNLPTDTIQKVYSVTSSLMRTIGDTAICRSDDGKFYIISSGTFLKWETALRKSLELIARQPNLTVDGNHPEICLQLAVLNKGVTDGDKKLIIDALQAISVKVRFCED